MIQVPRANKKNGQLSANASSWTPKMCTCQLVALQLVFSVVHSYTFLSPRREFWPREGRHNRIRHIDPPKSSRFQDLKLTQQAPAHDPSPPSRQKMYVWVCTGLLPLKDCIFLNGFATVPHSRHLGVSYGAQNVGTTGSVT